MNLDNFERQHKDIYNAIDEIKDLINQNAFEEADLAKLINNLAGKLNIHLSAEDKFLYPFLLAEEKTSDLTKKYMDEMGGIFQAFTEYKNKYNTKTKIISNKESVVKDTKGILDKINFRMNKEEKELYLLIK